MGAALCVVLKLLEWFLRLVLWLVDRYAEPQTDGITIQINIVDDDEDPPMRDVTPVRANDPGRLLARRTKFSNSAFFELIL